MTYTQKRTILQAEKSILEAELSIVELKDCLQARQEAHTIKNKITRVILRIYILDRKEGKKAA